MEVRLGDALPKNVDPEVPRVDADDDGFSREEGDCADDDPLRGPSGSPLFAEQCDGIDNNCDEKVDFTGTLDECVGVDQWYQTLQVDVLIVLDNTESMQPYWEKAAAGACAMVEHLMGTGYDSRIGVLMTDMESAEYSGKLVEVTQKGGDAWIIGNGIYDVDDACQWLFYAMTDHVPHIPVDPSLNGGRAAVSAALGLGLGHGEGANPDFRRADADLAILFLSDADDLSEPDNDQFLIDLFDAKEGTGGGLSIYAVTQVEEDCDEVKIDVPYSVLELVAQTAGMSESVCNDDYTGFLSGVGQDIATKSLGDTFLFTEPARLGTVDITIGMGSAEPYVWAGAIALEDPWTLKFTGATRPPAGATIYADYQVAYEALR